MVVAFQTILDFFVSTFSLLMDFSGYVLTIFNTSVSDIVASISDVPLVSDILEALVNVFPVGDYTLLQIMLGGGIIFYFAYQLVVWLLNIIT